MAKSDNAIEQIREQRGKSAEAVSEFIVRKSLETIPFAGKAIEYIKGRAKQEKEDWFDDAVLDVLATHEVNIDRINKKLESADIMQVVAAAVEEIFWGASETKIRRFAAVVANVIEFEKTQQELEDATAFIRTLDELSEDDIRVLKHLYFHQKTLVQENHAMPDTMFFDNIRNMLTDMRNLRMQPDIFFARCNRLAGYGLAIQLPRHPNMAIPNDLPFRMTSLGKRLMVLLEQAGEDMNAKNQH